MIRLVVLGAGRGAAPAAARLLAALPRSFQAPVAVVQHLGEPGVLDRLRHASALPLIEADDKTPLRPGHVLVAPEGYHMLIDGHGVALTTAPPEGGERPAILPLFETARERYGDGVVAVLLGETGADGEAAAARCGEVLRGDAAGAASERIAALLLARTLTEAA